MAEGLIRIHCTLPVQICKLFWFLIIDAPPMTYHFLRRWYEERKKAREQIAEESSSEEEVIPVRERGPRRRKGFQMPEVKEDGKTQGVVKNGTVKPKVEQQPKIISGGLWTDDDLAELMKLMKKFPQGTQERWEKIGDAMGRPMNEVAHMAHKMKDEAFKPMPKQEEEKKEEEPKKVKTKGGKLGEDVEEGTWSQLQQKAFEQALTTYPKGSAGDRWEKISRMVPGKTKEECMLRYKNLHELLRKKKDKPEGEPEDTKNGKEKVEKSIVNIEENVSVK